jgi:acyl-[acyl-carrier-protein]-phospholipid O-acyltransferase/long-chain-fatty-acid--[acyl-carrier-protein] ligase
MGVFSILLAYSGHSFWLVAANLTLIGFFGGLFAVPLNALLQQRSGAQEKGRLMATNNFLNMVGILLASATLGLLDSVLGWSPDRIVLAFGVVTLLSSIYVLAMVPEFLIRFSLWLLTHTVYRIRIVGQEHVPVRGPALLVCNHLSHVDGALVGACVQRFIRFLVYRPFYEHWDLALADEADECDSDRSRTRRRAGASTWLERSCRTVTSSAFSRRARSAGRATYCRSSEASNASSKGSTSPVIPVYLDRVWGSIFSFKGGRFLWKLPVSVPYPVTVAFGTPLSSSTTAPEARLALMTLGADLARQRRPSQEVLGRQFVRTAKQRWRSFCMADATRPPVSFGRALVASLLLSKWIRRNAPEKYLALLLPSSVGGALANIAATFAGKIVVNLNFTAGPEAMAAALERCQIKTILTSRVFIAKAGHRRNRSDGVPGRRDETVWQAGAASHAGRRVPAAGADPQPAVRPARRR